MGELIANFGKNKVPAGSVGVANPAAVIKVIAVADIVVPTERLRALQPKAVEAIAQSMTMGGQIHPIAVRPWGGAGFMVIAGWHRFEAKKALGHETILAMVYNGIDADQAELLELDENLCRAELSPSERAMHIGKRKELYEKLHPETKHGAAGRGGKSRQVGDSNERFTKDLAQRTGQSERAVQRDVTRANKVVVLSEIAGTCLDKGDEIDALAKLPEAEQRALAERAKAGEAVSAKEAGAVDWMDRIARHQPVPPPAVALTESDLTDTADIPLLRQRLRDALRRAEAAESERDLFMEQLAAITAGTAEAWHARSRAEQQLISTGWGPWIVGAMGIEAIFQNASAKTHTELKRCVIRSLGAEALDPETKAALRLVKQWIDPTHQKQLKAEVPSVATNPAGPATSPDTDADFPEMPPFPQRVVH